MLNELGEKRLTEILLSTFGKACFNQDELTDAFWVDLYITGNELFRDENGLVNLDFFWSQDFKEWILADKTEWLKGHRVTID